MGGRAGQEVAAELSLGDVFLPFLPLLCPWHGVPVPLSPGYARF